MKSHSSDLVDTCKMTALLCLGCGEDLALRAADRRALQGPPAERFKVLPFFPAKVGLRPTSNDWGVTVSGESFDPLTTA